MCIRINKIILFILSLFLVSLLQAKDMSIYKLACKEKGITEGTEKFGACVMDLYKNKDKLPLASKRNDKMAPYKSTCSDIGFKKGTEKFGKCVLKLYSKDKTKKNELKEKQKALRLQQQQIAKEQQMEARRSRLEQLELQEREQRLAIERERLAIEKERADREKWGAFQKSLENLADSLDPYKAQRERYNNRQQTNCVQTGHIINCNTW